MLVGTYSVDLRAIPESIYSDYIPEIVYSFNVYIYPEGTVVDSGCKVNQVYFHKFIYDMLYSV